MARTESLQWSAESSNAAVGGVPACSETRAKTAFLDDPYERGGLSEQHDVTLESAAGNTTDCSECQGTCSGALACLIFCIVSAPVVNTLLSNAFSLWTANVFVGTELDVLRIGRSLLAAISICLSFVCAAGGWRFCSGRHGVPFEDCPASFTRDPCCRRQCCCRCSLEVMNHLCNHWFANFLSFFSTMVVVFLTSSSECYKCHEPQVNIHDNCTWLCEMYDIQFREKTPTVAIDWQIQTRPEYTAFLPPRRSAVANTSGLGVLYSCTLEIGAASIGFHIDTSLSVMTFRGNGLLRGTRYMAIRRVVGKISSEEVNFSVFSIDPPDNGRQSYIASAQPYQLLAITFVGYKVSANITGLVQVGIPVPLTSYIDEMIGIQTSMPIASFTCSAANKKPVWARTKEIQLLKRSEGIFSCAGLQREMLEGRYVCNSSVLRETRSVCCKSSSQLKFKSHASCPWVCSKKCGLYPDLYIGPLSCSHLQKLWLSRHISSLSWMDEQPSSSLSDPDLPNCSASARLHSDLMSGMWDFSAFGNIINTEGCCPQHCVDGMTAFGGNLTYFLILFSVGDILIRVAVQGGGLSCSACRNFISESLHLLELILLPLVVARWVAETFLVNRQIIPVLYKFQSYCALTPFMNFVVSLHRFIRIWIWLSGTSLQGNRKRRQEFKSKFWSNDYDAKRAKHFAKGVVRLQRRVLDTWVFQCFAIFLFSVFALCNCMSIDSSQARLLKLTGALAYVLIIFLVWELLLRSAAQGGTMFFGIAIHKAELVVAAGMLISLLVTHEFPEADKEIRTCNCVLFWFTAFLHRGVRIMGIWFQVSAIGWGAQGILDNKALQQFQAMFGDLIEVPLSNIEIKTNVDIRISICKAKLKPEVLERLHLPVVPCGGLVEELEVTLKGQGPLSKLNFASIGRKDRNMALTQVNVKNVLILCSPGQGLAEAGGTATFGSYWSADHVQEMKSQFVELMSKRLNVAQMRAQVQRRMADEEGVKQRLKKAAGAMLEERFRHLEINIKNTTMQFEDDDGVMGREHMVMSLKIGLLRIQRHFKEGVCIEAARIGIRVETRTRLRRASTPTSRDTPHSTDIRLRGSNAVRQIVSRLSRVSRISRVTSTASEHWRDHYVSTLREHPEKMCAKLVRSNVAECFRMWSYDILDRCTSVPDSKYNKRMDMGPDRYVAFSLLKISLNAGPEKSERAGLADRQSKTSQTLNEVKQRIGVDPDKGEVPGGFTQPLAAACRTVDDSNWFWHISLRPIRIHVDDEQVRNLRCVVSSVRKWFLHDNALRWRPHVSLKSLDLEEGFERRSVAQMWWIYAVHGVLAARGKRPNLFSVDVMWRAQNLKRYKSLLMEVSRRNIQGPTMQLEHLSLSRCEAAELKELQLKLTPQDIVRCRRAILVQVVEEELIRSKKVSDSSAPKSAAPIGKEHSVIQPPKSAAPTPKKLFTNVIASTFGTWELSVPEVSVWLLQWTEKAERPVILKAKFVNLFLQGILWPERVNRLSELNACGNDQQSAIMPEQKAIQASQVVTPMANTAANLLGAAEKTPVQGGSTMDTCSELTSALELFGNETPTLANLVRTLAPFSQLVMSLDFFHIGTASEQCAEFKGPRHVCVCTAPLNMPRPSHPGLLGGYKIGQPVALAIRISPGCVKAAACEIVSGEICAFFHDSLLLAVKKHLGIVSVRDTGWYSRDHSELSEIVEGIVRKDVRINPYLHGSTSTMEPVVRERLRIKKSQKLFQQWVRAVGNALKCSIAVNMRALHVMQIGIYSSKLLVEELRCLPFLGLIRGGDFSSLQTKGASLSFNGDMLETSGNFGEMLADARDDSITAPPPASLKMKNVRQFQRPGTVTQDSRSPSRHSEILGKNTHSFAPCLSSLAPICCVSTGAATKTATVEFEEIRILNTSEAMAEQASIHDNFRNCVESDQDACGGPEFELRVSLWEQDPGFPCALNLQSARWRASIASGLAHGPGRSDLKVT